MKKILLSVLAFASYNVVNAQCSELFISEYVEGAGNSKAIEIYNPTSDTIDLSIYSVARYSNGAFDYTSGGITQLSGKIAPKGVHVLVNGQITGSQSSPACDPALQLLADQLDGAYPAPTYMNGNDAIGLLKNSTLVDIFGKIGEDPGVAWTDVFPYISGQGAWITKDHTMQRKATVKAGVTSSPTAFDPMLQYDTLPENTWTGLGAHTCDCLVSIKENKTEKIYSSVYPNPLNSGSFVVRSSAEFTAVNIYDVLGKKIYSNSFTSTSIVKIENLTFEKGLYFVEILKADKSLGTIKLVKE